MHNSDPSNITIDQYGNALQSNGVLRNNDLKLLNLIYNQPHHEASVVEITETLGMTDLVVVNGIFGRLGNRVKDSIGKNSTVHSGYQVLAEGRRDNGYYIWTLRRNFVVALEKLNLVYKSVTVLEPLTNDFYEGLRIKVTFNGYERSIAARNECLKHFGRTCEACHGEKIYGAIGEKIIQVHHLVPISEIGGEYKVDPVADLIPLCPNCHAAIHASVPPLSIEELKQILKLQSS